MVVTTSRTVCQCQWWHHVFTPSLVGGMMGEYAVSRCWVRPGSRWQVGGFSGPRLLAAAGSSGAVLYTVHPHTAHSQTRTIHTSSYKTTGWSPTFTNPEDPHIHNDIATMMINRNVNKLSQTSRQYMDFYNIAGEVHNRQLNACIQRHSCCI